MKQYNRRYYELNKIKYNQFNVDNNEILQEKRRVYYLKNRTKILTRCRAYYVNKLKQITILNMDDRYC